MRTLIHALFVSLLTVVFLSGCAPDGSELDNDDSSADAATEDSVVTTDGSELDNGDSSADAATEDSVVTTDGSEPDNGDSSADAATEDSVVTTDGSELDSADSSGDAAPEDSVVTTDGSELDSADSSGDAATEDSIVTIYLSAGAAGECWRYELADCRIYRLRANLTTGEVDEVVTVVDTPPAVHPTVNPSETRIAYDTSISNGMGLMTTARRLDPDGSSGQPLDIAKGNKPQWSSDDDLLFGMKGEEMNVSIRWNDVVSAQLVSGEQEPILDDSLAPNPWPLVGSVNPQTGFDTTDCSASDPFANPVTPNQVAFHSDTNRYDSNNGTEHTCPWLEGIPDYIDTKSPLIVVADTNATEWEEGETWWSMDFALVGLPAVSGCAHAAFSPDGTRLLCTNQPSFYNTSATDNLGQQYDIDYDRIYGWDYNATTNNWDGASVGPLFNHLAPDELPDIDEIWTTDTQCNKYRTKRAEFCGDNEHLVANVYCEDTQINPQDPAFAFGRITMIDFENPTAPVYHDLTSALEDHLGTDRGSMSGYTVTCGGL
jgi:hypothetical protein